MSRHRDLKQAQHELSEAADEMITVGLPVYADDYQVMAFGRLERAMKDLREIQNTLPQPAAVARDTSIRAARAIKTGSQRHAILEMVVKSSLDWPRGLTADEIQHRLTNGKHQSVSARVHELEVDEYIYDSRRRRETSSGRQAIVWFPTDKGVARIGEP